jgi:hypothetical protein
MVATDCAGPSMAGAQPMAKWLVGVCLFAWAEVLAPDSDHQRGAHSRRSSGCSETADAIAISNEGRCVGCVLCSRHMQVDRRLRQGKAPCVGDVDRHNRMFAALAGELQRLHLVTVSHMKRAHKGHKTNRVNLVGTNIHRRDQCATNARHAHRE